MGCANQARLILLAVQWQQTAERYLQVQRKTARQVMCKNLFSWVIQYLIHF